MTFTPWSGRNLKLNGTLLAGSFLPSPSSHQQGQQEEHKYAALNVPLGVFVTLMHNWHSSGDDKISPISPSCPQLLYFASQTVLPKAGFTIHHVKTSGKKWSGWAAWQLVGPVIVCHWHTAPAPCVKENKPTGDPREMISKHETPTPPKTGSCTMHTVWILPAWVHATCTWRAEDWFAVQY